MADVEAHGRENDSSVFSNSSFGKAFSSGDLNVPPMENIAGIARGERDGTRAETRFHLSPKRTSPFKSVGASVQSTAGSRGVHISLSNAGYTMFGGGVRVLATHSIRQFPLHFPRPCVTVCHQVPNALYKHKYPLYFIGEEADPLKPRFMNGGTASDMEG